MKARILSIEKNRAEIALLNDRDQCKTGGCGGCRCSSRQRIMKIDLPEDGSWGVGDILSLKASGGLMDFMLLIAFPVAAAAGCVWAGLSPAAAIIAVIGFFTLSSLFLRFFRAGRGLCVERLS